MQKPLIIKDIQQGSDEWRVLRMGKATASNFNKIITPSGNRSKTYEEYALELASEMFLSELPENIVTYDMRRGTELEPEAKRLYQEITLDAIEDISFFDCGDYGYSPDGLVGDDGLIEVKCPASKNHYRYICTGEVPDIYYAQCQGALMVSGRKWIDFVSYNPSFKHEQEIKIVRIYPDDNFITSLYQYLMETIEVRNYFINLTTNNY